MDKKVTSNGKKGGNLVGKPHNDKDGKPIGGIKAVVTDAGGKMVELEGGEVIINKAASKKYWRELSKINQSAGNGVPIGPPIDPHDEDPEDYEEGGKIIDFNPNHIPNKWILKYAESIKKNYPEIWKKGGNIFGNEAFLNLQRAARRGYWLDSEKWMYIKWRSYVARHKQDFRIEGVVAMLKWCDKVNKGWAYMKDLIESEIQKSTKPKGWSSKVKQMVEGGEVDNSKSLTELTVVLLNHLKKYSKEQYGEDIDDTSFMMKTTKKGDKHIAQELSATTKSGIDIHIKVSELYMKYGGELEKGIKTEMEHKQTIEKFKKQGVSDEQVAQSIAKDHLKEDPQYYSKHSKIEQKFEPGGKIPVYTVNTVGLWMGRGKPRIQVTKISPKTISYLDFSDMKTKSDTKEKFERLFIPDDAEWVETHQSPKSKEFKVGDKVKIPKTKKGFEAPLYDSNAYKLTKKAGNDYLVVNNLNGDDLSLWWNMHKDSLGDHFSIKMDNIQLYEEKPIEREYVKPKPAEEKPTEQKYQPIPKVPKEKFNPELDYVELFNNYLNETSTDVVKENLTMSIRRITSTYAEVANSKNLDLIGDELGKQLKEFVL